MTDKTEAVNSNRRKFLKQAGKVAVTAPAAAMILSAASRPALAQVASGQQPRPDCDPSQFPNGCP